MKSHNKLLLALVAGLVLGTGLHSLGANETIRAVSQYIIEPFGQLFLRLARAKGWSGASPHAIAGAAPSLLTLALPFSWQEAFVPAALFGGLTGLAFWHLNRPKSARPPDAGNR